MYGDTSIPAYPYMSVRRKNSDYEEHCRSVEAKRIGIAASPARTGCLAVGHATHVRGWRSFWQLARTNRNFVRISRQRDQREPCCDTSVSITTTGWEMKVLHSRTEQRRERRNELLAGQLFVVDLTSGSQAPRTQGVILNISKGGMAVQTFRPFGLPHAAELRLSFPRASSSPIAGVLAWQKAGGLAGIRFLNAPLKNLPKLRQVIGQDGPPPIPDAPPLITCRTDSSANELEASLHLFACSAMALTSATGAAIALGNSSGMECRASVGNAPEVGTQLRPETGLSGHSLRTGAVNLCDDAWIDSRVNATGARQLNSRSIMIVPITTAGNMVGLLEVFSPDPNHFDERHVRQLQPLVNLLATVPETVPHEGSPAHVPEPITVVTGQDAAAVDNLGAEHPAETYFAGYSRFTDRSQPIAIAIGILAALLVFAVALAWLAHRNQARFPGSRTPSITAQDVAQNLNGSAALQAALQEKPVISFDPPQINQKVGDTFRVDVLLKGARDVASAPAQILYDPEMLQVITATGGGMLDRDGQAATLVQRVDPSGGRIDISVSRPTYAPGISGDGVVFTLMFRAIASGNSSLHVSQTSLRDTSARIVSVNSSNATVTLSKAAIPSRSSGNQITAEAHTRKGTHPE